jgi:hypothetical protein
VRIITQVIADIKVFTFMLIFAVSGFATTMYLLNRNN